MKLLKDLVRKNFQQAGQELTKPQARLGVYSCLFEIRQTLAPAKLRETATTKSTDRWLMHGYARSKEVISCRRRSATLAFTLGQ